MPKGMIEKRAQQKRLSDWIEYLSHDSMPEKFDRLKRTDSAESSAFVAQLWDEATRIWQEQKGDGTNLERLGQLLNNARAPKNCPPRVVHAVECYWDWKKASNLPRLSRWKKRDIAYGLGLLNKPYYLSYLLDGSDIPPGCIIPQFVIREKSRNFRHGVKSGRVLSEVEDGDAFVTNEDTGFDVIRENKSVIYFGREKDGRITIELVVLRNVGGDAQFSAVLFDWAYRVIVQACSERRDVRPAHPGQIVQLGLNMGPLNARAIGLAVSFTDKQISRETQIAHDRDAVGIISLAWGLIETLMPQEVIEVTNERLKELQMPELETPSLPSGGGYTVKIGDREVTFPASRRAPPEGYLSNGYEALTHIDKAYTPYCFTFNVDRRINPKNVPKEAPKPSYQTRGASQRKERGPKPTVYGPPGGGGSFVDISLGVVVRQAPGTMMAIRPAYIHGTTKGYGYNNSGITISFSERLVEAWNTAKEKGNTVESFQNTDDH